MVTYDQYIKSKERINEILSTDSLDIIRKHASIYRRKRLKTHQHAYNQYQRYMYCMRNIRAYHHQEENIENDIQEKDHQNSSSHPVSHVGRAQDPPNMQHDSQFSNLQRNETSNKYSSNDNTGSSNVEREGSTLEVTSDSDTSYNDEFRNENNVKEMISNIHIDEDASRESEEERNAIDYQTCHNCHRKQSEYLIRKYISYSTYKIQFFPHYHRDIKTSRRFKHFRKLTS